MASMAIYQLPDDNTYCYHDTRLQWEVIGTWLITAYNLQLHDV
jgi:hypothetical protein